MQSVQQIALNQSKPHTSKRLNRSRVLQGHIWFALNLFQLGPKTHNPSWEASSSTSRATRHHLRVPATLSLPPSTPHNQVTNDQIDPGMINKPSTANCNNPPSFISSSRADELIYISPSGGDSPGSTVYTEPGVAGSRAGSSDVR